MQPVPQLTKRNIAILKKISSSCKKVVDSLKIRMVYLKVLKLWMIFEMMSSVEIHIMCCISLVGMIMCRILARMTYLSDFEILNRPASICSTENSDASASAYCAKNPGAWALWFGPDGAVISKFVRPPPFAKVLSFNLTNVRDIFISKFHELVIIYKVYSTTQACGSVEMRSGVNNIGQRVI
jgi:hypothetical protein